MVIDSNDTTGHEPWLQLNPDGSLVRLEPGSWFVCFVPGIEREWWHPFAHHLHKHTLALRPEHDDCWTLFEPWWTRLEVAMVTTRQARKYLLWGSEGDVLLAREAVPGRGGQVRGWMNCAALVAYLLGRPYWVWTPHRLYRRMIRESGMCPVDASRLLECVPAELVPQGSRVVEACEHCQPGSAQPGRRGSAHPFCMKCGRDLDRIEKATEAPQSTTGSAEQ